MSQTSEEGMAALQALIGQWRDRLKEQLPSGHSQQFAFGYDSGLSDLASVLLNELRADALIAESPRQLRVGEMVEGYHCAYEPLGEEDLTRRHSSVNAKILVPRPPAW